MSLRAFWYGDASSSGRGMRNWGDVLTPHIIEAFSGQKAVRATRGGERHLVVGSILHRLKPNDRVWGCGAISPTHVPTPLPPGVRFHAVRGPLTRDLLVKAGAGVPPVYGDPALLVPYIYQVEKPSVTHRLGVLPHYVDQDSVRHLAAPDVKIIDISSGMEEVIREVCSCETILSSSLHGVILGDCYASKVAWLTVQGGKGLVGKDFKFRDYLLSTGRDPVPTPIEGLPTVHWLPKLDYAPQALIGACPFNNKNIRRAADLSTRLL